MGSVARKCRFGAGLADRTDAYQNQSRAQIVEVVGTDTQPLESAGPEVLQDHIRCPHQKPEDAPTGLGCQVEHHASLAPIDG